MTDTKYLEKETVCLKILNTHPKISVSTYICTKYENIETTVQKLLIIYESNQLRTD